MSLSVKTKKILFLVICTLLAIFLFAVIYFIRTKTPIELQNSSTDIIAVLALILSLGIPNWDRLFNTKTELREYHVSPLELLATTALYNSFVLRLVVENTGNVDVNLRFVWIDDDRNQRWEVQKVQDDRFQRINNSVKIEASSEKELLISFYFKNPNFTDDIYDAVEKKDLRLIEGLTNLEARLCWSDATKSNKEVLFPFGQFIKHAVQEDIAAG